MIHILFRNFIFNSNYTNSSQKNSLKWAEKFIIMKCVKCVISMSFWNGDREFFYTLWQGCCTFIFRIPHRLICCHISVGIKNMQLNILGRYIFKCWLLILNFALNKNSKIFHLWVSVHFIYFNIHNIYNFADILKITTLVKMSRCF